MTNFRVIIPSRYASTRLPGKPLLKIADKYIVQHVYEHAVESGAESVVIATDDERIKTAAESFGGEVCMTSPDHVSGSTRIAEVAEKSGYADDDIIVNVQGDEPLIPIANITQVAENLAKYDLAAMATLCEAITTTDELFDPNAVKVVFDKNGYALYFSRAPILWERGNFTAFAKADKLEYKHFRHVGIYAYRCNFLKQYSSLDSCELEEGEKLEQLRAMWHGEKIHVALAKEPSPSGVDTQEDLDALRKLVGE